MAEPDLTNVPEMAWAHLWRPAPTSKTIPEAMQNAWYMLFDSVATNMAMDWCGGTLIKTGAAKLWYIDHNNEPVEFHRGDDLAEIAKRNVFIHNAFRDNFGYSPY